jgi:hypothetical protein
MAIGGTIRTVSLRSLKCITLRKIYMSKRTRVNKCAQELTLFLLPLRHPTLFLWATFSTSCSALSFLKLILLHKHRLPNQTGSIGLGFEFLGRYHSQSHPEAACEDRQHENRRASFDRFLYRPTSFAGILHVAADGRSPGSLLKALWASSRSHEHTTLPCVHWMPVSAQLIIQKYPGQRSGRS